MRLCKLLTASADTKRLPFSLKAKIFTGAVCGPFTVKNSLSEPFHVRISPLSQLHVSIFRSGCHVIAVTCDTG